MGHTRRVLDEVYRERVHQDEKWGEQNHPNGTGPYATVRYVESQHGGIVYHTPPRSFGEIADFARRRCDYLHQSGKGTWEQILTEEVFEAYAESDPTKVRAELVQVAAVVVAWIEAIDRDAAKRLTKVLAAAIAPVGTRRA